ncbi:MAG: FAD-binding oxidoreductase [Chloroflexaceae bacterium]
MSLNHTLALQPGALLATAPATTPIEEFNAALAPHGLCLPIFPLTPGISLSGLVARNAGGRRALRYGPIGRYLRAATLEAGAAEPLVVGGPTIKRATGYGLHRALAGGALDLGALRELTFSLRPLPAAREARLLRCADLPAACRLAARLLAEGLALSALAVAGAGDAGLLLAELEGQPPVLARQMVLIERLAAAAAAQSVAEPAPWTRWERLTAAGVDLALSLPRAALPAFVETARTLARRYRTMLALWGDAGVGRLCLRVTAGHPGEVAQLVALLRAYAADAGGVPTTEEGPSPVPIWRFAPGEAPALPAPGPALAGARRAAFLDALAAVVGPRYLLTSAEALACYAFDASSARPDGSALAVALPGATVELAELVRLAAAHGVPVVARGASSGLAGGAVPSPGALVIGLNRMQQIRVEREQQVVHVGAGAITAEVQRAAEAVGLFYPPDPSSQSVSTIGGNLACNAGGSRCVKYGVTADYALAITAVLADGRLVRWGDGLAGQAPDNGLVQLLIGAEGTLGIIAEATLRLLPLPRSRRTVLALFASLEAACATVEQIMAAGVVPAGLELLDDTTLEAVEAYAQPGLPRDTRAMLLMLADGEPEDVEADTARLAGLARAGGAREVHLARDAVEEAHLWKARRAVSVALGRVRPNRLGEDICVPLPRIAECARRIKAISAACGLPIAIFGHAGDGNLHPNILFDARNPVETARLWPAAEAVFAIALELGGTLSGEHGIGTLKRSFMPLALGPTSLAAQRQIKAWLDPRGLLNPGKVLPD